MQVVLATEPGTPGWPNEDFAAVAPGAAVLLDGCTTWPRGTVTAVRVTAAGFDLLALADSVIVADYGDDRPPLVITDTHRAASASTDAAGRAYTATLPSTGLRGIALLSDGATRITDKYGLLSWSAMLAVIRDDGPAQLIRHVRAAEDSDPGCTRWPRSKARDDATIIYWPEPAGRPI